MSHLEDAQAIVWGKTKKVLVPSGRTFIIRETNGEDDDILSNEQTAADQTNVDHYLSRVVVKELIDLKEVPFSFEKARKLLRRDRIYLLVAIREHNLGPIVKFTFDFGTDPKTGGEFNYTEDIRQYLHDYTKDFPEQDDEEYFKYKIPPYPENAYGNFELQTQSGKRLRMHLIDGHSLGLLMKIEAETGLTKNSYLLARELQIEMEGNWVMVKNFQMFSSRDMVEIRKWEEELDPDYRPITEIKHPRTGMAINYNILSSTDFFYPVEI